jgi:Ni2+-binding GTPase involved in maturation of urease and hydrogenase
MINEHNFGQVTMQTELGILLHNLCKQNDWIHSVVEIGTWYGMGSTKCIIEGLKESNRDGSRLSFISLEIRKQMYDVATDNWKGNLPEWARLIHGRIVELEEMDMDGHGMDSGIEIEDKWLEEDRAAMRSCENVFHLIPQSIDLLFLDGGGYTTTSEFYKLKDRSTIIVIDDTNTIKGKKIRDTLLQNQKDYDILIDEPKVRNGIICFVNKSKMVTS